MKKLLTLAVIAAFAGVSQAATLSWQLMGNKLPSGDTGANLATFLFVTSQTKDAGASLTTKDAIINLLKKPVQVVKDSNEKVTGLTDGTTTITSAYYAQLTGAGGATGATNYGAQSWAANDSLSAFVVIFDAADVANARNYITSDVKTVNWTGPTGAQTLRFGTVAPAGATWTPVPEPSTAALALAGLALLLKRRRA